MHDSAAAAFHGKNLSRKVTETVVAASLRDSCLHLLSPTRARLPLRYRVSEFACDDLPASEIHETHGLLPESASKKLGCALPKAKACIVVGETTRIKAGLAYRVSVAADAL